MPSQFSKGDYLVKMTEEIIIPKETLIDLYWNKNKKPREIAKLYGIKNERTVLKKMERYGIKRKSLSEAMTIKFKMPFSGDLQEKAYFIGLRAGDFHVKKIKQCVRIQTSTTHAAQVNLLRDSFQSYGKLCIYLSKNKSLHDEWFIYTDLDSSFYFLLEKPINIPKWILDDDNLFFNFLAAYIDCEGNWHLTKSHEIHSRFTFRLRSGDKQILENIREKLESLGYRTVFSLDIKKGKIIACKISRIDIYNLTLNGKIQISNLIEKLLPLSKHSEKIQKMKFMLKHQNSRYTELLEDWIKIKDMIRKEILVSNK